MSSSDSLQLPRLTSLASGKSQQLNKLVPELRQLLEGSRGRLGLGSEGSKPALQPVLEFHWTSSYEALRQIILRARRDERVEVKSVSYRVYDTPSFDLSRSDIWLILEDGRYCLRHPEASRERISSTVLFREARDETAIVAFLKRRLGSFSKHSTIEELVSELETVSELQAQRMTVLEGSTNLFLESVWLPETKKHFWSGTLRLCGIGSTEQIPKIPCFSILPVRCKVMEDISNRKPALYAALAANRYPGEGHSSDPELNYRSLSLQEELDREFSVPRDEARLKRMGLNKWPILHHDFLDQDFECDLDDFE